MSKFDDFVRQARASGYTDDEITQFVASDPELTALATGGPTAAAPVASPAPTAAPTPASAKRTGPPGQMGKFGGVPGNQFDLSQSPLEQAASINDKVQNAPMQYAQGLLNSVLPSGIGSTPPPSSSMLQTAGQNVGDMVVGAGKRAVNMGTSALDNFASLYGKQGPGVTNPDILPATAPTNTAQTIGSTAMQIAPYMIPVGGEAKLAAKIGLSGKSAALFSGVSRIVANGLKDGTLSVATDETPTLDEGLTAALYSAGGQAASEGLGLALQTAIPKKWINTIFKVENNRTTRGWAMSAKTPGDTLLREGISGASINGIASQITGRIDALDDQLNTLLKAKNVAVDPFASIQTSLNALKREYRYTPGAADKIQSAIDMFRDGISSQLYGQGGQIANSAVAGLPETLAIRRDIGKNIRQIDWRAEDATLTQDIMQTAYHTLNDVIANAAPESKQILKRMSDLIITRSAAERRIASGALRLEGLAKLGVGPLVGLGSYIGTGGDTGDAVVTGLLGTMAMSAPGTMGAQILAHAGGAASGLAKIGGAYEASQANQGQTVAPTAVQPTAPTLQQKKQPPVKIPVGVAQLTPILQSASDQYGVPVSLLAAQVHQESSGNPNARSDKGAIGVSQFLPSTAADFGLSPQDLTDPAKSIPAQAAYMRQLYDEFGSWPLALAAYNAGPGTVRKAGNKIPNIRETQAYVKRISAIAGPAVLGR